MKININAVANDIQLVSDSRYISWDEWKEKCEDVGYIDIRLQVLEDGQWFIHSGLSDYDQNHYGVFGASSVGENCSMEDAIEIARKLINQANELFIENYDIHLEIDHETI